jgi:hypothetical protein
MEIRICIFHCHYVSIIPGHTVFLPPPQVVVKQQFQKSPIKNGDFCKIKTKPSLVVGDTFSNSASIYFDYNFPIVTNSFTTTITALATQDFDFGNYFTAYPSPARNSLTLETKAGINVKTLNIYDVLGQIVIAMPNPESVANIDVSDLKTGTYFIKVTTNKGTANKKFIKK